MKSLQEVKVRMVWLKPEELEILEREYSINTGRTFDENELIRKTINEIVERAKAGKQKQNFDFFGIIARIEQAIEQTNPVVEFLRDNAALQPERAMLEEGQMKLVKALNRFRAFKGLTKPKDR